MPARLRRHLAQHQHVGIECCQPLQRALEVEVVVQQVGGDEAQQRCRGLALREAGMARPHGDEQDVGAGVDGGRRRGCARAGMSDDHGGREGYEEARSAFRG